jgi:hypothetical protein
MSGEVSNFEVSAVSIAPISMSGAVAGDWITLKNHAKCMVSVMLGTITTSVTIRLQQATAVAGTAAKALLFDSVVRSGGKITCTPLAGTLQEGETVTGGTSAATGKIHRKFTNQLILHTITGTFQTAETITGGTSAATATTTSAITDFGLRCRVAMTAASTIALTNAGEIYSIDIDGSDLDVANGFDCIMADVTAVGGASLCGISYLLSNGKYKEEPQKSPLID